MQRTLLILIGSGLFFQLTSCVTYIGRSFPVLKPLSENSTKNTDTSFTEINAGLSHTFQPQTSNLNGSISVHKSRLFRNFRLSYGAFSYLGNAPFSVANASNAVGLGVQTGAGYTISTPDVDWKIIGTDLYLQKSLATFPNFQRIQPSDYQSFGNSLQTMPGLSSEVLFKKSRHPFGLKLFVGKPFGRDHDSEKYVVLPTVSQATAYSRHKNVTAFAQLQISQKVQLTLGFSYSFRKKMKNPGLYVERK